MPNIVRIVPEINVFKIDVDNEINIPTHGNLVDKITAIDASVADEAFQRSEADITLQANINTETFQREEADITLQSNIDAEATARTLADEGLQASITAESQDRTLADEGLQANIDAEATARTLADENLQSQIDTINNSLINGVDWKAPVADVSALQASYATDAVGSVRLVQDQKDAFIKVSPGSGEDLSSIGLTGEASTSYVRFIDSQEIASGLAGLQSNINTESQNRILGDEGLQAAINAESQDRTLADEVLQSNIDNLSKVHIADLAYVDATDYSNYLQTTFNDGFDVARDVTLFINNSGSLAQNVPFDNGISLRIPSGESAYKFVKKAGGNWYHI